MTTANLTASAEAHLVELPPYRFWETRSGSGTPIVLIHGLGGSSDWWRLNVAELSQDHTVAAVDLIGFGRNRLFLRASRLPPSIPELAAVLARWIAESFDEPVHLVGNSMGGHVAIHLAARRPELVRSLTLVNATGIPFEIRPGLHLENIMIPQGAISFGRVLARDVFRSGPTSLLLALGRLLRDDVRPLLPALTIPVLLLWGDTDPLVPLTYAEQFLEALPDARLVPVPCAGHVPMWESPRVFNEALLRFVEEIDARPLSRSAVARAFGWGLAGVSQGLAWRRAGERSDVVLIHGLGMSSVYFKRLARALFRRGIYSVAVDLPGFGESENAPPLTPLEHADRLASWARELALRDVTWIGHSTGCDVVAQLVERHPALARRALFLSPVWTRSKWPLSRLALALLRDVFREPPSLLRHVVTAYWRTGAARWAGTVRRELPEICRERSLAETDHVLAGVRDPLMDRQHLVALDPQASLSLPGAHAFLFSHPDEATEEIEQILKEGR